MQVAQRHPWQVSTQEAREIQQSLARQVIRDNMLDTPRFIAGADISVDRADGTGTAAIVVLDYPGLQLQEVRVLRGKLDFPYIPGLLSFREAPLVLAAWEKLSLVPDLLLVDGQGIAHPRRLGIAAHLGLLLDIATIGCAKSRLCGCHEEPGSEAGSNAELIDGDEVIGAALRTRAGVKPIYVSIGNRVDLETAVRWTLSCCRGYRLPEPTRLAHLAAGGNINEQYVT